MEDIIESKLSDGLGKKAKLTDRLRGNHPYPKSSAMRFLLMKEAAGVIERLEAKIESLNAEVKALNGVANEKGYIEGKRFEKERISSILGLKT